MPSPSPLSASNKIAISGTHLRTLLNDPNLSKLVASTHVDWPHATLRAAPSTISQLLRKIGGLDEQTAGTLTPSGLRLLGKLQFDLEHIARTSPLNNQFDILEQIGTGSSSIALKAKNKRIGRTVVLKILRPGLPENAARAIEHLGGLEDIPHLVAPIDSHPIDATSSSGDTVRLYCLVFPYVDAQTLEQYFRTRPPVTPLFFDALIRQIGGVLDTLEKRGLSHGDLHGANILISSDTRRLEFTVIDPSPGLCASSPYARTATDFQWFKEHLTTSLLSLQRHLTSISIQKHLGPKLFSAISTIIGAADMKFSSVIRLVDPAHDHKYAQWLHDRQTFIDDKFTPPPPLGLLRWEEISDPAAAVDLFAPYPELFRRILAFGNSLLVGARGSGKSTYLAALAYFPGAKKRLVPYSDIFGVLFSCRQGEFKQFSTDFLAFDPHARLFLKHVLVLKIIRRLLRLLSAGCSNNEMPSIVNVAPLYDFVDSYIRDDISIPFVDQSPHAALENLAAGTARWEEHEIARLFLPSSKSFPPSPRLLNESALLKFCNLVREHIPSLSTVQFYFLFDDAGEPNIPSDTQKILNDLLTSSNSVYCIKLSAERSSYSLSDSRDRTLEETHDFTSFDISSAYGTTVGSARPAIRKYFADILAARLRHWHYATTDIADFLGDCRHEGDVIPSVKELIGRLAEQRRNAYYAGWEVVWQLADKTPRNLIELVTAIFAEAGVQSPRTAGTVRQPVAVIDAKTQDRAIRAVSNRRLRSLEFIPGATSVMSHDVPIGKQLYTCASSFASVSLRYLTGEDRMTKRLEEILAIELNNTDPLWPEARRVLQLLVRYGVFDDSSLNVARDDKQKKAVYVFNRIYCPAFGISFRRDAHLRVSAEMLQTFLLQPDEFAKYGTEFLRDLRTPRLWDD